MSGYVVCRACGTRIKAGRTHCLRCFAPLPEEDEPVQLPIWESLGLDANKVMVIVITASLLVVALIVVIWRTWPEPLDQEARPVAAQSGGAATPAAAAAPSGEASADPASAGPASAPLAVPDTKPEELTAAQRADLEASRVAYEKTLEKTPNDAQTLDGLGLVLARLNRPAEAVSRVERAVELDSSQAAYHLDLARVETALGDYGRAVEEYREAARLLPQDPSTRYSLALALQKNSDHEAALAEFERAIALAPGDPRIHFAYGVSFDQLRRPAEALREYRRYIEMRPTAPYADEVRARIQALAPSQP